MRKSGIFLMTFLFICSLLIIGVCIHFTAKGCRSSTSAAAAMRRAEQRWQGGQIAGSLSELSVALRLCLRCGVRRQMAQPHIDHMLALYGSGDLEEAIAECVRTSQALGGCDAKEIAGSLGYWCNVMEMQLLFSPTLTPTPEAEP